MCALRILKSEVCIGVPEVKQAELRKKDPQWDVSGTWGVIHFANDRNRNS